MSHQDVAAIWSTLQGRLDIDNIVQELIGRYYLKASQHRTDRALLRACAFDHIVALRTIFDLQRAYLQSSELSLESRSSFLHPSILLSAVSHLLEVKDSAISRLDGFTDHDAYCTFIGQTILSGLRALLLQKGDIQSTEHEAFVLRFEEVWGCETLRDVDHFVINLLCRRILAELSSPDHETQYTKPACGAVKLRDLCQDQYPDEEHSNAVVEAARNSLAGTRNSADWFEGALIVYDTFWSTTAALIQLCVDVESRKQSVQWSFAEEAIRLNHAHLILVPRFQMLDDLYQNSSSQSSRGTLEWAKEQVKTMICLSIQPSCFSHECMCLGEDRPVVHKMWLQHGGRKVLSVIHNHVSKVDHLEVEGTLKELRLTLDVRNDTLPDFSKELKFISQKLAHYNQEWCPNLGSRGSGKNERGSSTEDVFVINCPDMHPMAAKNLLSQLNSESFRRNQQAPAFSNDIRVLKDVPSRISCDHCSWQSTTISARRIEPLLRLSEYVTERLKSQREMDRVRLDLLSKAPAESVSSVHTSHSIVNPISSTRVLGQPRHGGQEQNKLYRTPGMRNLRPTTDDIRAVSEHSNTSSHKQRVLRTNVSPSGALTRGPSLRKVPSIATTYVSSTSSTAVHTSQLSSSSSRTFSPPLLPSQFECTTLPEVVEYIEPKRSSAMSIRSDQSPRNHDKRSVWSLFRSGYGQLAASSTPSATFFSSGKTLLLWNSLGAVCYEVENMASTSFRIITTCDVMIAAGGMRKCAVVSKNGANIILRIFLGTNPTPAIELELEGVPIQMAVSKNDQYVALKYGSYVRILDTVSDAIFSHKLPMLSGRSGQKDHLIAFSNDCLSFVASTRCEPEKVVTFTAGCQDSSIGISVESCAPYGLVGDDGLSSIVLSDNSAFLTTYTEKGYPVHLSLSDTRPSVRPLRDKSQHVGSRIHKAVLCPTGQNLVLINDHNEIYWISTPFGREQAPVRVASIKRARSVRREVEMAFPGRDEVHVFWIEKGKGVLVTVGRNGGRSKPAELNVNMEQLLEG